MPNGKSWWRWYTPIRTTLERPFTFKLQLDRERLYQEIAAEALSLRTKGLSYVKIAELLGVTDETVKKAIQRNQMR